MIQFDINGQAYQAPTCWEDVTLAKWLDFVENILPIEPECMQGEQDAKFTSKQYAAEVLPYVADYVSFWTGAPRPILMQSKIEQLEKLYLSIAYSLVPFSADADTPILEHDGQMWHLPRKAFEGATVQDFIEAAQYQDFAEKLGLGQWGVLPKMMCILVRKSATEPYSPELLEREADFLQWPMDKCLQVSFFLLRLGATYLQDFQFWQSAQTLSQLKQELRSLPPSSAGIASSQQ
jgi:hypothetical protein